MSNVRTYKLPSTYDERLRLTREIERDAAAVLEACGYEKLVGTQRVWMSFGFRVRDAHRKTWGEMDMAQLRRCAARWGASAEAVRASKPPLVGPQAAPPPAS